MNPLADVRDIGAGITHVAQGKDGAGFELGASLLGAIPVVGDAGKAILRGGRKVATEVAEETAERAAKEVAERAVIKVADEVTINSDANTLARRIFERPTTKTDAKLPAGEGYTDKYGNITYSTVGTAKDRALVYHHEKVHQFFSPKFALLREFRADVRMTSYQKSSLMRYLEEAMAESYAQMKVNGIKNLPEGIAFPITNGYVKLQDVVKEGAIGTIAVGGTIYGVYTVSSELTKPNK